MIENNVKHQAGHVWVVNVEHLRGEVARYLLPLLCKRQLRWKSLAITME